MKRYESWGRYPKVGHEEIVPVRGRGEVPDLSRMPLPVLPYGQGRSYGDCCLNEGGILLDTSNLDGVLAFDQARGILRCEAGVTFAELLDLIVPHGWFLPVVPGTKWVSVGGAIANDVHGKNHHRAGTFGCYMRQFELLRSTGERLVCSPSENPDFFRATIAGLGLTGLILWAEIQLTAVPGPLIQEECVCFGSLPEFFELSSSSDRKFDYTVAWVDCLASGRHFGRGLFFRGNHVAANATVRANGRPRWAPRVPFNAPNFLINRYTIRAFNAAYYRAHARGNPERMVPYQRFFFPLDGIGNWNLLYGKRGFLQYQCVVRPSDAAEAITEILGRVAQSGTAPSLSVLKTFGEARSPGMLSFPRPGATLALDFAFEGEATLRLLEDLDAIVRAHDGAVYPAKDARMSVGSFQAFFPQSREFSRYVDPKFSSSFWRRVAGGVTAKDPREPARLAV